MMGASDTKVQHPLTKVPGIIISLISTDQPGKVEGGQASKIPPSGFHLTIVMAIIITDYRSVTIVTVHILGIALGIRPQELQLESDSGSEPLTDTNTPVRRDGTLERAILGIVSTESVRTSGGIDEPVLTERVSHNPARIQKSVPLGENSGPGLGDNRVAIDLAVVFVHLINLTPSRRGGQKSQGDNCQNPAYQIESFHNQVILFFII